MGVELYKVLKGNVVGVYEGSGWEIENLESRWGSVCHFLSVEVGSGLWAWNEGVLDSVWRLFIASGNSG